MAQCYYPYQVERKLYLGQDKETVSVPCGKCPECLKRRLHSWTFRLQVEALNWETQHFLTLTYNNENCPTTPNGFMTLDPAHLRNFYKRLRKRSGKIKYYSIGEYGTQFKRPHYHVIMFGTSALFADDIIKEWPYGDVYFGKVESGSIAYTVQYYDKGTWHKAHQRDDRHPEFSRMSNGIGKSFLTEKQVKSFLDNPDKGFIYNLEGKKIAIPRYFTRRLYDYLQPSVVAEHPSILIHRDEMIEAKEIRDEAIAKKMLAMKQPELSETIHQDRFWAIKNYQNQKRKTRK